MKPADKDKPVRTIPKGVWEGGIINDKDNPSKNSISTKLPLISRETDTRYLLKIRTIKLS